MARKTAIATFGGVAIIALLAVLNVAIFNDPSWAVPPSPVDLDIQDVGQEPRRPDSGWCGESSIQMAMSFYGAYASQQNINRAGKPAHPDLYSNEVPVAMAHLGLEFQEWQGGGLKKYLVWIQAEIAAGHPVLVGVKIYPTAHPEWNLDHFMLVEGCTQETLTYNTTWKRQDKNSLVRLSSMDKGLSFANRYDSYYGYSITGLKGQGTKVGNKPTRVRINPISGDQVELHVIARDLEPGKHYCLLKYASTIASQQPDAPCKTLKSFVAKGSTMEVVEKIGIDDSRVYECAPE